MVFLFKKFKAALNGILIGIKDRSILIQLILGCCVIGFGLRYSFAMEEWLWIISAIFAVIISEWMNTAVEKVCDLVDMNENPKIKVIKDLSAGGVLIASFYAVIIGCMILKGVLR